jgi:hypothetical protein
MKTEGVRQLSESESQKRTAAVLFETELESRKTAGAG